MHRADPGSDRPASPHRRGHRHHPADGAASMLLGPPPGQGPVPLIPRRASVTIRPLPPARRISRADVILHICAVILAIAVLAAIFAR
jgi:hypothetical protein